MTPDELKLRTRQFGLRIIRLVQALDHSMIGGILGKQLVRSGTSVGANYRAACRARSDREFMSKLNIVIEEADEAAYWLELIIEAGLMPTDRVSSLLAECNELIAIMVASRRTTQVRTRKPVPSKP